MRPFCGLVLGVFFFFFFFWLDRGWLVGSVGWCRRKILFGRTGGFFVVGEGGRDGAKVENRKEV